MQKAIPLVLLLVTLSTSALSFDTLSYRYDDLGRLVEVVHTGGPNNGFGQRVGYDPAGNRTNLVIDVGNAPTNPPPPPPPPPPANNRAPIANPDNKSLNRCSHANVFVLANDTDPDGDVPLRIVGVQADSLSDASGVAEIVGSYIEISAPDVPYASTFPIDYTVEDTRGARATGRLSLTVTASDDCN